MYIQMPQELITRIENRAEFLEILKQKKGVFVIKFGADWCGPCKIIEEEVNAYFKQMPDNVQCAMIDIDVSLDLYAYLKSKKIISAIPTLLCYHKENTSYVPDDIHTGTDKIQLNTFFENCKEAAASALE
jgi:thiol-disulfide isomerase/thioredoxin